MDQQRFEAACRAAAHYGRTREGIGRLGEKTLHAALKLYLEPDTSCHEIKHLGFVADIKTADGVIEIQTRSFGRLRRKLAAFLEAGPVTVAYPVPAEKWVIWVEPESGAVSAKHKSPKRGTPYEILYELYAIRDTLRHPNLRICILLIDLEEFRFLDGWSHDKKRGSTRYDRIPLCLADEVWIDSPAAWVKLVPEGLPAPFTARDYQKASRLSLSSARTALNVLHGVGAVERVGKQGGAYLYEVKR